MRRADALLTSVLLASALLAPAVTEATTRSSAQRREFASRHACPSTHQQRLPCPGHVIDHVVALDCGGRDHWTNMQWQTVAAAREKDRWERGGPGCRHRTRRQ